MNTAKLSGTRKQLNIQRPRKYKKWLIWPSAILNNIHTSGCEDTVEGICYKNISIEECMNQCPADDCGAGIYVDFENGKTICLPIRTLTHPKLSPLYRLREQQYYPSLDPTKVKTSVFINTNLFPFPPNLANTVFFDDILTINLIDTLTNTELHLDTNTVLRKGSETLLEFGKGKGSPISIQPVFRTANSISHDRPVVYGDKIVIFVPGTSYIAQGDFTARNNLLWRQELGLFNEEYVSFSLLPVGPLKQLGDLVTYSDTFVIDYNGLGLIGKDGQTGHIHVTNIKGIEKTFLHKHNDISKLFSFTSRMEAYYCENGNCKTVDANNITPVPYSGTWKYSPPKYILSSGTYKGHPVLRQYGCWNRCEDVEQITKNPENVTPTNQSSCRSKSKKVFLYGIISIVLFSILIIIGARIYKKRRS